MPLTVMPLFGSETAAAAASAGINYHTLLFVFFSLITCGFALAVLFTSNIVRMAFYLTICLGSVSGLFFLAGSEFIGAMQLMIYVGGTLVLLIFGVMLTAQQRFISMETSAAEWVLAAIVGSALLLLLVRSGASVESWNTPRDQATLVLEDGKNAMPIGLALSGVRVDKLDESNATLRFGKSGYLLPFVIVSMHLLVVLIGAAYMARTKRQSKSVAAPVAAVRTDRKFGFLILAGIIKGWVVSILAALLCFSGLLRGHPAATSDSSLVQQALAATSAWPVWLLPTLGILLIVNALLLWVVYSWQQWGAVGLLVMPFVEGLCFVNAGLAWLAPIFVILAVVPVVALVVLLRSGRPSPWSQMD